MLAKNSMRLLAELNPISGALLCFAEGLRKLADRRGRAVPAYYRAALRLLAGRGQVRPPAVAARDFARGIESDLGPEAAAAFEELTELYLAERFGADPAGPRAEAALLCLRKALRARRRKPARSPLPRAA